MSMEFVALAACYLISLAVICVAGWVCLRQVRHDNLSLLELIAQDRSEHRQQLDRLIDPRLAEVQMMREAQRLAAASPRPPARKREPEYEHALG